MKARKLIFLGAMVTLAMVVASCAGDSAADTTEAPGATDAPGTTDAPTGTDPPATTVPADAPIGDTYKIGVIASVTGASFLGVPTANTAEMMQAVLDEQGGLLGPDGVVHPVEIIVYDSESNPDTAASAASRLITEDEVHVLVAGNLSGNALAMVPLATEAEVPMIGLGAAGAIVTDPDTGEARRWIFKTPHANDMVSEALLKYLNFLETTSVCLLYENSGYGQDTLNQLTTVLEPTDIAIAYSDSFERTDTEFPQVVSVTGAGCDVVMIGSVAPGLVTGAIVDSLPDVPIVLYSGGCDAGLLIDSAAGAAEGAVLACTPLIAGESLPDDNPNREHVLRYIDDYEEYVGIPASAFGGMAYDGLLWSLDALGTLEDGLGLAAVRAAMRDAIETRIVEFPGTSGTYTITPEDHLGLDVTTAFVYVRVENDEFAYYPEDRWER